MVLSFLHSWGWLLSFLLLLREPSPGENKCPQWRRVGLWLKTFSSPIHSSLRLRFFSSFPFGCHFLILPCSHCLLDCSLFFQAWGILWFGTPHHPEGRFSHCSGLISIPPPLVSENTFPLSLCTSLCFSHLTPFTLSVHTGERKLNSNSIFWFPVP